VTTRSHRGPEGIRTAGGLGDDPFDEDGPSLEPVEWFLNEEDQPGDEDFVERLIPARGLVFVVGEPGSYKTSLLFQLALCATEGLPFLGHHVRPDAHVVYIGFEGGRRATKERIRREAQALGIASPGFTIGFQQQFALDDYTLARLEAQLGAMAPCAVVIDSYAQAHSLDEVGDAPVLLKALHRIGQAAQGPVILAHHPTKASASRRAQRLRGHGSHLGAADVVLFMSRRGKRVDLSVEKARDFPDGGRWRLEFDPLTFLLKPVNVTLRELVEAVVRETGVADRQDLKNHLMERTGKTPQAVNAAIRDAIRDGTIQNDGRSLRASDDIA